MEKEREELVWWMIFIYLEMLNKGKKQSFLLMKSQFSNNDPIPDFPKTQF
jgi:hypothetical protein